MNYQLLKQTRLRKLSGKLKAYLRKMLSKEFQELEINLLITRTVMNTRLVTVSYAITKYGLSVFRLQKA